MKQWVSIEGPIGAGKSTLISSLSVLNGRSTTLVEEPVDEWIDSGMLKKAYENPQVYNFPAQCTFFTSRIKKFKSVYNQTPANARLFISERCAFSDMMFWDTQVQLGRVAADLYDAYRDMWDVFQCLQPMPNPTLFVYLRPNLEECMKRVKERGRVEESTVDVPYQEELLRQHDQQLGHDYAVMPDGTMVPCLTIDGNVNFRDDPQELQKIVDEIEAMLPRDRVN